MAYGIEAHPVGPGPAAPASLFIDSGITFPQFLGSYNSGNIDISDEHHTFNTSWDGAGTLMMIPTTNWAYSILISPDIIPTVGHITGYSVNGSQITFNISKSARKNRSWSFGFDLYKIWPQANQSYGVTFSNTANFFALNDGAAVGQCVWAYQGQIGDGTTIGQLPGGNQVPANATVFAYWDQGDTVVGMTPSNLQFHITHNRYGSNGGQSVYMKVVAFANTGSVPEHNGGFNIYNANHTACVFSTLRSPFMVRGWLPTAGGNPGVTQPMVPLLYQGMITGELTGSHGWMYVHNRGWTSQGGGFGNGFGTEMISWTNQYKLNINVINNFTVPVLSAVDYFA